MSPLVSTAARRLLSAYAQGVFPMADPPSGRIDWYLPLRRGVIPLDPPHIPRRLLRTLRAGRFAVRYDTAFHDVMTACAEPAPGRESSWINDRLIDWYSQLHHAGFAHSAEAWQKGRLAGGTYGVALGGLFAGESMFHRATDAGKVALAALLLRLRDRGFLLFDTQFWTPNLAQFGCREIDRDAYFRRLAAALSVPASF